MANPGDPRIDPRTLPNYGAIERSFQQTFGADKDFSKFLTDMSYRDSITQQHLDTQQGKGLAGIGNKVRAEGFLSSPDFLNMSNTVSAGGAFKEVDLDPIFDPLRQEIGSIAEQNQQFGRANVSAQARGAQAQATEGLAGTGLGRSGVAAEQFQGIAQRKQDLLASVDQQVAQQKAEQLFKVSLKQSETEYSEQLREAGFTQGMVQDALGFDRALLKMQFEQDLADDAQGGNWFSDLVNIGASFVPVLGGIQGLGDKDKFFG